MRNNCFTSRRLTIQSLKHSELLSANLRLASSHLDLVALVTFDLKNITYSLKPQNEAVGLDHPMFRQALSSPEPLKMIEARHQNHISPWHDQPLLQDGSSSAVPTSEADASAVSDYSTNDHLLLSQRLESLSMSRVETTGSLVTGQSNAASVTPLSERFCGMRRNISNIVGIPIQALPALSSMTGVQDTFQQELEAGNVLNERFEREMFQPGHLFSHSPVAGSVEVPVPSSVFSRTESISRSPLSSSPPQPASSGGISQSPEANHGTFHLSPPLSQNLHSRASSTASSSLGASRTLARSIPVTL